MDLSKIPYGSQIKAILHLLVEVAKAKPEKIPYLCNEIRKFIDEDTAHKPAIQIKNEFIAVIGDLHGSLEKYKLIAKKITGEVKLEFYSDIEKIKNGSIRDKLESDRCIGIILGGISHSIAGNPEETLSKKVEYARLSNGTLKLTHKSFEEALRALLLKIKY